MSTVSEYLKKERELKRIQAEMRAMEMSTDIAQERAFREQLSALMRKYGKTSADLLQIASPYQAKEDKERRARRVIKRTYKNPMTGEIVDHLGGRFPLNMKEWIDKYGKDVVDTWKVSENGVNVGRFDPIIPESGKVRAKLPIDMEKEHDDFKDLDLSSIIGQVMHDDAVSHSSFYA